VFSYFTRNFAGAGRGIRSAARECALRLGLLKYLQYSFALVATK
jgi:hypothetical protein